MRFRNRLLSLIVAIFILVGTLAGCGSNPPTTPPDNSNGTGENAISDNSNADNGDSLDDTQPAPSPEGTDAAKPSDPQTSPDPSDTTQPVEDEPTETPIINGVPVTSDDNPEEPVDDPAQTDSPVDPEPEPSESPEPVTPSEPEKLDDVQRNSIAMLNYLTVLTQEISSSKGSRLFLEQAYSSLINNTYPNAVDVWTQGELDDLLDTLEAFRMVSVKRERLQLIYEHNKAQALRSAIPNPINILSNVSSRGLLKTAVSLIFMAVDSVSSYNAYNDQNDLQHLKDGWDLDDEEATELSTMRRNSFSYMINMVRDYSLPGDLALNENAVTDFVTWKNKTNVVSRISILESNEKTYEAMGSYWLTLAKSYYENGDYRKCLEAIDKFESITSRIFRKDYEYAETLPYAILAAQELYSGSEYESLAKRYCDNIISNTDSDDWASHYFVALIYMDLYSSTKNSEYIDKAYRLALDNVTYLVDEQKELNSTWLEDVQEVTASKNASKQEKEDIKQYNKLLKEERKTALPPVSEPLYLNCDLLFALAEKKGISYSEKVKIDAILHENGDNLFLVAPLDNCYRYTSSNSYPNAESMEISFDGKELTIPAYAVSSEARISVTVKDSTQTVTIDDWAISKVTRPSKGGEMSFTATYKSESIKSIKYHDGTTIQISVYPRGDKAEVMLSFKYEAKETGLIVSWNPIKTIVYERVSP